MKVRTRVTDPTTVDVTIQMTMTVREWNLIRAKFTYGALEPAQAAFGAAITRAVERIASVLEDEVTLPEVTQ